MAVKTIVCLANSRKLSGRCLAGKDRESGAWLRPVSNRQHEEVSERERAYEDGSDPQVLDIIAIPLLEPKAKEYQTENWLLDPAYYWTRRGRLDWAKLAALSDQPPTLWNNGESSYNGENDRISHSIAQSLTGSLCLIQVNSLSVKVFAPGSSFGDNKRRVQGQFTYRSHNYKLWITDPNVERTYLARSDGTYKISTCYLTISLGEAHEGFVYKLIAAVIAP